MEAGGLLDYQGRAGIISIVRWNLRLVIPFSTQTLPTDKKSGGINFGKDCSMITA